jgi:hypothetical protein
MGQQLLLLFEVGHLKCRLFVGQEELLLPQGDVLQPNEKHDQE